MYNIIKTERFEKWFKSLKDLNTRAKIDVRIRRMELGNLGDIKPVGEGVSEARIHYSLWRRLSSLFLFARRYCYYSALRGR